MVEHSRRRFLGQLGIAGAVGGLAGVAPAGGSRSSAAEPPSEITTVTPEKIPGTCMAPAYVAEALLRAEGFNDIRYRPRDTAVVADALAEMDSGASLTLVAGIHPGCYELIAHDDVRSVTGL